MQKLFFFQLSRWFFLLFLCLLFFNARWIANFDEIKNLTGFRENQTWSLFLFDSCLIFGFLVSFFDKSFPQTEKKKSFFFCPINVEKVLFWGGVLVFLSWLWRPSLVSSYASGRFLLGISLFFWIKKLFEKTTTSYWPILPATLLFWSGILQTLLAIGQFGKQKSLGLFFLGESHLSKEILGVAKIELWGEKFIRAYGTFPHPNLLGAFLLLSLTAGLWLIFYSSSKKRSEIWFLPLLLLGIFFTFSRTIWLATGLLLLFFFFFTKKQKVFAEKILLNMKNFQHSKKILTLIFFFFLVSSWLLFPFFSARFCLNCTGDSSLILRKEYAISTQKIIRQNPLEGVGIGNFTLILPQISPEKNIRPWEIQPVHNLYLLATAELGIGMLLFFLALFFLTIKKLIITANPFSLLFLIFLGLGFFDHYFWTLPQGQLLFFLTLAFSNACCKMKKSPKTV